MRIAAFTGGRSISSSRFRVRQYIPELRRHAIAMAEFTAPLSAWPPANRLLRPAWALASLAARVPAIVASHRYDLTFLQREFVSTFRTLEGFTKGPRILDLDDAVWLSRESQLRKLVAGVDGVVCGNDFIDAWVGQWNENHTIVPTAVDTDRWHPRRVEGGSDDGPAARRVIGWTGLHAGAKYLLGIERPLARVLELHPDAMLRVVSDQRPDFRLIPRDRVEYIRWSADREVSTMQEMTVGLMPLADTEWERGKCSYKMLLYMACGVPVVVSPVGMNSDVLARGEVGLAARDSDEWVAALTAVLADGAAAARMGAAGRRVVCEHFSLQVLATTLAGYFRGFHH